MKTSAILLMTLVTLTFLDMALAGKGHRGRNKKENCRYDRKSGAWSECDAATNKKTKTMNLKANQPSTCEQTKTIEKPCNVDKNRKQRCRYDRKSAKWSNCDPATSRKTKVISLKAEQPASCEPTKTITKQCTPGRKQRCRYDRGSGTWSNCDPSTNKKTKVMSLKVGQPAGCEPTKTIEKPCNRGRGSGRRQKCRYDRRSGSWSECDPTTSKKTKVMTLKPEQPSHCDETKTVQKSCNSGQAGNRKERCRYDRRSGSWSECDPTTNKKTKVMTLKPGQPSSCEQTKLVEETCTPGRESGRRQKCRYDRRSGSWSECDPNTNKKTKVMTLKPGQPSHCDETKTVQKSCKSANAADCEYERLVSDCINNKRTISYNLVSGGDNCPQKEPKEKQCGHGRMMRKEKKAERKARRKERRNERRNAGQS